MNVTVKKLNDVFKMNNEFLRQLDESQLQLRISNVRSNTIGSQLACLTQAREAYSKCILEDVDFYWHPDFSYEHRYDLCKIKEHFHESGQSLMDALSIKGRLSENQESLIIDLIGHEYLHQGQLIRYCYANRLIIPNSIKAFWHLED